MASVRVVAVVVAGLCLVGCSLPKPDYAVVKQPPPYRTEQNGQWIDNEGYVLDAQGYRLDKQGQRIGMVDIPGKTRGDSSNAVAGFYISSTGKNAPGSIMVPSEGGTAGAGFGPGSANPAPGGSMPAPSSIISPGPAIPSATGGPVTNIPTTTGTGMPSANLPSATAPSTSLSPTTVPPTTVPPTTGPAATGAPTPITPTPSK